MKLKILFAIFLVSSFAEARPLRETYTSVRALGMGNAYTALVDDADSLFYNPAGLAKIQGISWNIIDPSIGLNGLKAYEAFQAMQNGGGIAGLLNEIYGDNIWIHSQLKSTLAIPGLAAGIYGASDISMQLNNPAYSTFDMNAVVDYGLTAGLALPVIPKFMSVGMSFRRTTRYGGDLTLGPSVVGTLNADTITNEIKRRGSGYGMDLGLNIQGVGPVRPAFSMVWKNVGVTKFSHEAGSAAPSSDRDEMIIGAGLTIDGLIAQITPTFDYKFANWQNVQVGKKIHLGLEVSLPLIDLRAGLNQGYYTLGAGVSLGFFRCDLASYGVELGAYPGQLEDRRYMVQLTLDMGFNPGFGFLSGFGGNGGDAGGGGTKRVRLKQRR